MKVNENSSARDAVKERAARVVYSLMKASAQIAARAGLPISEIINLLELAYFQELRARHPRDLAGVAEELGISLRTVGTLNKRLKDMFFTAEHCDDLVHGIISALENEPLSLQELLHVIHNVSSAKLKGSLKEMVQKQWLRVEHGKYVLASALRLHMDRSFAKAVDGFNQQMSVIAHAAWLRFIEGRTDDVVGRTWTFSVPVSKMQAFAQVVIQKVRHDLVELEESQHEDETPSRFGMTIAMTNVEEGL